MGARDGQTAPAAPSQVAAGGPVAAGGAAPAGAGRSQAAAVRWPRIALAFGIGMVGATVGSLIGLGGGFLMIPLMTALLGLTQHQAHGSSTVAIFFTAVGAALTYGHRGSVAWVVALGLAASGVVSARFGARFGGRVPTHRLQGYFGLFLVVTAVLLPVIRRLLGQAAAGAAAGWLAQGVVGALTGVLTGFVTGLLGIGGGAIVVAAMVLILGVPQHTAQGTALAAMIPAAASGAWTHRRLGHVVWDVAPVMGLGSVAGGWLGAVAAHQLASDTLRLIFSASIFLLGLYYIRRATRPQPAGGRAPQR